MGSVKAGEVLKQLDFLGRDLRHRAVIALVTRLPSRNVRGNGAHCALTEMMRRQDDRRQVRGVCTSGVTMVPVVVLRPPSYDLARAGY